MEEHTKWHVDCPACRQKAFVSRVSITGAMLYPEAVAEWIRSREFAAGKDGRARYLRPHSLRDLHDYDRPLARFFGRLSLGEIHVGNLKQYQEDRAAGILGPDQEELFALYLARVAKSLDKTPDQVLADPESQALVTAQVDAYQPREVGPNKINQELGLLVRLMKRAGVWTAQMEEDYEPLQQVESDIPRCLTPEEQEKFLQVGQCLHPFVHQYTILGIDCTLSTFEERNLQLGDINLRGRVVLVRERSAKNKYRIRTIPMSDQAAWAIERLMDRARDLGSNQPQHYLMPFRFGRGKHDPGKPMTVSGIKKPWDDVRREASVPWFTPYGLRHTGCTRLAEAGTPIYVMLARAGHMSRRTQEHYIHISEQANKKWAQRAYSIPSISSAETKKVPQRVSAAAPGASVAR